MSMQKFELPCISFFHRKEMANLEFGGATLSQQNSKGFPKCICLVCIFCVMLASCSTFDTIAGLKSRRECTGLKKTKKSMFPNIKHDPLVIFSQNSNCGLNASEEDPFKLPLKF